jgi:RpiR family carbohydrate utilization transcriptional regulator
MFVLSDHAVISRDAETVANQVYEATAQALAYAFGQRDPAALQQAALAIVAAERVFCMGTGGSSANIAQEAENRLFRFDIHVTAIQDEYKQRIAAAICNDRDVLLIFSVTGQPHALRDSARIAAAAGAKVIAVTRPGSPLAALSSILLPLEIPDNDRNFEIPNRSRYGQLYILDSLATLVASRRVRLSAVKLRRFRTALQDVHGPTEQQPIGD